MAEKNETITVSIHTEFIKLDSLLKFAGFVTPADSPRNWLQQGAVRVNGEVCTMRGKKIRPGDAVTVDKYTVRVTAEA